MAGLGLVDALNDYEKGVAWKQEQAQKQQDQQDLQDQQAANVSGAAVINSAKQANLQQQQQAWTEAGNDPSQFQAQPYNPDAGTILKAMDARTDALMKSGNVNLFVKGYAATVPVRNQIRQKVISSALAQYNQDGDGAKLAQTVYPTIDDGVDIKSIDTDLTGGKGMQGASAQANAGQKVPPAYKINFSNGKSTTLSGDQIAGMAHDAMMDPNKVADYEFQAKLQQLKDSGAIKVDAAKVAAEGEQARQTENVKGGFHLQGIQSENQNRLQVGAGNNAATVQAAGIHAGGEVQAAGIHATAETTAAQTRAAAVRDAAKARASANGVDKRMTTAELTSEVTRQFGDPVNGPLGGTRIGGEKAAAIAGRADEIRRKNPNVTDSQAILQSAGEFGFKFPASTPLGLNPGPASGAPGAAATGDADYSNLWGGQ